MNKYQIRSYDPARDEKELTSIIKKLDKAGKIDRYPSYLTGLFDEKNDKVLLTEDEYNLWMSILHNSQTCSDKCTGLSQWRFDIMS